MPYPSYSKNMKSLYTSGNSYPHIDFYPFLKSDMASNLHSCKVARINPSLLRACTYSIHENVKHKAVNSNSHRKS
jgi:hypothetical protein